MREPRRTRRLAAGQLGRTRKRAVQHEGGESWIATAWRACVNAAAGLEASGRALVDRLAVRPRLQPVVLSGIPEHRSRELSAATAVVSAVGGLGIAVTTGRVVLGGVVGLGLLLAPVGVLRLQEKRRRQRFLDELPDVLHLLAGAIRSGLPLTQAIGVLASETEGPVRGEFARASAELALGQTAGRALRGIAVRMTSDDVASVAVAVEIHRQSGGNLAEVIDIVASGAVLRQRLQREIATLTAEGRISAIVLGVLPILLGALLFVTNPEYLSVLLEDPAGQVMMSVAAVSMVLGFMWMRRIVSIDE